MKLSDKPIFDGANPSGYVPMLVQVSAGVFRLRRVPRENVSGVPGSAGAKGDKGDAGATGATGATGANGTNGTNGTNGATGATGATGAKGDKGDTGAAGVGGAGVGGLGFPFSYRTSHTLTPASGEIRFAQNPAGGTTGTMSVSQTSSQGQFVVPIFSELVPGTLVYIVDSNNPAKWFYVRLLDSITDASADQLTFPVKYVQVVDIPADNAAVIFAPFSLSPTTYRVWDNEILGASGAVVLDLSRGPHNDITLAGNVTFSTSNGNYNREVLYKIVCDGTQRTLTFPVGWVFVGGTAPANIAANKTAILRLYAFGVTEGDVIAEWRVQS